MNPGESKEAAELFRSDLPGSTGSSDSTDLTGSSGVANSAEAREGKLEGVSDSSSTSQTTTPETNTPQTAVPQVSTSQSSTSSPTSQDWHYVTVPLTLADLKKKAEWEEFFAQAKQQKLIPVIRLTTQPMGSVWQKPTKKDIADELLFLSQFEWPTSERYIIVFNEVNHAQEWGGTLDPAGYAELLEFAKKWAVSEQLNYKILPAAMDLATPNTAQSREAFTYLEQMLAARPHVFESVDYWNSHSYPNPGFVSSPERKGKNSLRGFEHELAFVKKKTGKDLRVFITETGWRETAYTKAALERYYSYALQHIWSDERVVAVTPFVLRGDPGPFSQFSFLTSDNRPTLQYQAFRKLVLKEKSF